MSADILAGLPEVALTTEQENTLALRKDDDSLNVLIEHNLREAFKYGRACFSNYDEGTVLSAAYDGLRKAAINFKPEQIRFFAYAKAYVRSALLRVARDNSLLKNYVKPVEALPDPEAQADAEDAADENDGRIYIKHPSPENVQPAWLDIFCHEAWETVRPVFEASLSAEERCVILLNFQGGLNYREIGAMLGVSRARIGQIKKEGLARLKFKLRKSTTSAAQHFE